MDCSRFLFFTCHPCSGAILIFSVSFQFIGWPPKRLQNFIYSNFFFNFDEMGPKTKTNPSSRGNLAVLVHNLVLSCQTTAQGRYGTPWPLFLVGTISECPWSSWWSPWLRGGWILLSWLRSRACHVGLSTCRVLSSTWHAACRPSSRLTDRQLCPCQTWISRWYPGPRTSYMQHINAGKVMAFPRPPFLSPPSCCPPSFPPSWPPSPPGMEFVFQATGSGQIGPVCPRRKIWESHGSHFLVLKSFRK